MQEKTYIYTLRETGSDEVRYVGKTVSPETRFKSHCYTNHGTPKSKWIASVVGQRSDHYELEKITTTIIDECPTNKAADFEAKWIKYYTLRGDRVLNVSSPKGENKYTEYNSIW